MLCSLISKQLTWFERRDTYANWSRLNLRPESLSGPSLLQESVHFPTKKMPYLFFCLNLQRCLFIPYSQMMASISLGKQKKQKRTTSSAPPYLFSSCICTSPTCRPSWREPEPLSQAITGARGSSPPQKRISPLISHLSCYINIFLSTVLFPKS